MNKIPIYQPSLSGNEKKYVMDCLESTWISSKGKYINEFEEAFAQKIGVKYAVATCNGTTALHLALLALGINEGDEIIVPTLTYIASVNAIVYTGAVPIFVDSREDTWNLDPLDVKEKITSRTKAIIAVHLYGHPCDMDSLQQICRDNNLFLIEDAAEAFGAMHKGKNVGSLSDIAIFSFFGNKTITTGEGGMVVTNDKTLIERASHFKGQGLAQHREYWHDVVGYNYRMTNICAAIGLAQLERADEFIERKLQLVEWYKEELKGTNFEFQQQVGDVRHSYWMFSILVSDASLREPLRNYLAEREIETRPLFYPVHTMPMYVTKYARHKIAENLSWRGINLPSFPMLTKDQIQYITTSLKSGIQWIGKK